MLSPTADPIVAIATAPGRGAVGIVRVSGRDVTPLARALTGRALAPRVATYGPFREADGSPIDHGLAIHFPAPHSYTGEDVLELQAHGGPVVLQLLLQRCLQAAAEIDPSTGAERLPHLRLARPGEFTERAFLNGKLDLAQAEAVMDLIDASTESAARSASRSLAGAFSQQIHALVDGLIQLRMLIEATLDFPEEEIDVLSTHDVRGQLSNLKQMLAGVQARARQGALLREGIQVVIAGQPNAPAIRLFKDLLQRLDLPAVRVEAIVDWIDADNLALPGGGEDALYLRAEPPYRTANGPLASVQELRFVAGIDGAALARLAPYVTALPEPLAINVNTAPPLLLELLSGGQSGATLARRRLARPFASVQDWLAAAPGAPADYAGLVTTASSYFELDARITAPGGTRRYHTQLRRDGQRVSVWARQRIEADA